MRRALGFGGLVWLGVVGVLHSRLCMMEVGGRLEVATSRRDQCFFTATSKKMRAEVAAFPPDARALGARILAHGNWSHRRVRVPPGA